MPDEDQRVPPYDDPVREREPLGLRRTYRYEHPFNYHNVTVDRTVEGGEPHGMELMPIPEIQGNEPADSIRIDEEEEIVRVAVLGSACTPPGYVTVEADPLEGFRRDDEDEDALPVRYRERNLWGGHLRADQLRSGASSDEHPWTGMSCAVFELPASSKVRITAGSEVPGWADDTYPDDFHYSIREIRVTVAEPAAGAST